MDKIRLVTDQEANLDQDLDQGVKMELENRLRLARTQPCFLEIIADVNRILQEQELSRKSRNTLRNLRQKAYDRKKKIQESEKENCIPFNNNESNVISSSRNYQEPSRFNNLDQDRKSTNAFANESDAVVKTCKNLNQEIFFLSRFLRRLDQEMLLKKLPQFVLFSGCAGVTLWFVWLQSVPLYQSIGFSDPELCAFGALIMLVGFPLFHAITRSKLLLMLCLFACTYEVLLIVQGTFKDEVNIAQSRVENNRELVWLVENARHIGDDYNAKKVKYEDPSSSVYKNSWYKAKYLDPVWNKYQEAQNKTTQKRLMLTKNTNQNDRLGFLKILYRLGLVILCMVSIHQLIKLLTSSFNRSEEQHQRHSSSCH